MKKVGRNSIIILLLTILVLYFMLKKDYKNIMYWLVNSNKLYLIIALAFYVISLLIDSSSFHMIIKQYSKNYTYKQTLKLNVMTKFFNGVTPLSSGGQPLQIYELYKNKVKLGHATNIVVQFFIIYQIAIVIFSTIAVILNNIFHIFVKNLFIRKLVIFGYIFNVVVLFFLFLISLNKNFNFKVISFFIKILSKLKIVKNKEEATKKWEEKCESFYDGAKVLKENPSMLVKGTLIQMIQLVFLYLVPFFIAKAIHDSSHMTVLYCIVTSSYVNLIGSYIIVPGATGGIEYGFIKLFSNFLKKSSVMSVTILWRFITYYLPVIFGGIIFNFFRKANNIEKLDT